METTATSKKKWYKTKTGLFVIFLLLPFAFLYLFFWVMVKLTKGIWGTNLKTPYKFAGVAGLWGLVVFGMMVSGSSNSATLGASTSRGNCVGPDGKRLYLSDEKCKAFNDAWKNPQQTQQAQQAQTVQIPTSTPTPTPTPIPPTPVPTNVPIRTQIKVPTKTYVQPTTAPKVYVQPTTPPPVNAPPVQNNSGSPGGGYTGGDKDCGDFSTHAEAQAFYVSQGGPGSDPHDLDRDRDGSACETLP